MIHAARPLTALVATAFLSVGTTAMAAGGPCDSVPGPADGPVVLLLHGQSSWSYLYRRMIPVLADAGFRV